MNKKILVLGFVALLLVLIIIYLVLLVFSLIGRHWEEITYGVIVLIGLLGLSFFARWWVAQSKIKVEQLKLEEAALAKKRAQLTEEAESARKGREFEDYVRKHLFPKSHYKLIHRTPEFHKDDYDESIPKPDFEFESVKSRKSILIEAKYRSSGNNQGVIWCSESQLLRYKKLSNSKSLFIVLGHGGSPSIPDRIYLWPFKAAPYQMIYYSKLSGFNLPPYERPVSEDYLLKELNYKKSH